MSRFIPAHPVRLRSGLRRLTYAALAVSVLAVMMGAKNSAAPSAGERLYREGILPSNKPLIGDRSAAGSIEGKEAACVNCHRPSGFGSIEGSIAVPPVTAKYLFRPRKRQTPQGHSEHEAAVLSERAAYTDATLAQAIRDGMGPGGRKFNLLMPRYNLDGASMAALTAYLKRLSSGPVPGVTADALHFATIVTPDSDPVERKATLDVLKGFFHAKNTYFLEHTPPPQRSEDLRTRVVRRWQLHIWELKGDPSTWKEQLHNRLAREPVFAVISGIGGRNWSPVHSFCEEESIPCLLPNVELPVVRESDFYNVYFSRGVLLEADLIAHYLKDRAGNEGRGRIIQIYRADDIGTEASRELCDEAEPIGFRTLNHPLKPGDSIQSLAGFMGDAGPKDVVVLWLRPEDLKSLPSVEGIKPQIYLSGTMGGLEYSPLNGAWRAAAHMAYPFELPERRGATLDYPFGWFRMEHVAVVAPRIQVDTWVACNILLENLDSMYDDLVRDYLLEEIESMLSSRVINGYYSRLGLAPGQRFASKGGYIVRFNGPDKLVAESGWIVP